VPWRHACLSLQIADHLSETYGDRVEEVLSLQPLASPSEQAWNAERVVPEFPYLKSEVVYAVRNEWACTVVVRVGTCQSRPILLPLTNPSRADNDVSSSSS